MPEEAFLVVGPTESGEASRLAAILQFFGLSWRTVALADALSGGTGEPAQKQYRLFCSPQALLEWTNEFTHGSQAVSLWRERVHSAFVYGADSPAALDGLVRALISDRDAALRRTPPAAGEVSVTRGMDEFCGVMAGLRCQTSSLDATVSLPRPRPGDTYQPIIHAGDGAAFFRVELHGVPVFVSTATHLIDLRERLTRRRFDVRDHFLAAVPVVMYVRWAFPRSAWRARETNACLIIDDPLLKPRYGFLDYEKFAAIMARQRFSTSIAFIPWNWRRSAPAVVRLFNASAGRYSICVHGCDHTAAEFGTTDRKRLQRKLALATLRMERHKQLTGIQHDSVMVFPQGVFSRAAIGAVKRSGLHAVVNTGVLSVDDDGRPVSVGDFWDVAVRNYGDFPIFTRRYPSEGVVNFAFDALLGKPCLVVIHHDYLRREAALLTDFIGQLNGLARRLSWRSLGEVVRRSWREREIAKGCLEIEMYATELRVESSADNPTAFRIRKRELDVLGLGAVTLNSAPVAWKPCEAGIELEFQLPSGAAGTVGVHFTKGSASDAPSEDGLGTRAAIAARRYASEFRDNFVTPGRYAYRSCVDEVGRWRAS